MVRSWNRLLIDSTISSIEMFKTANDLQWAADLLELRRVDGARRCAGKISLGARCTLVVRKERQDMPGAPPETFAVRCPRCDVAVPAEEAGSYSVRDDEVLQIETEYLLLKCKGCSSPFLASRDGFDMGGDTGWGYRSPDGALPGRKVP